MNDHSAQDLVSLVEVHALTADFEREMIETARTSARGLFEVMERAGVQRLGDYGLIDLARVRLGVSESQLDGDTGSRLPWRRKHLRALVGHGTTPDGRPEFHILYCPHATTFRGYRPHPVLPKWNTCWDRPARWRAFATAVPGLVDMLHEQLTTRGSVAQALVVDLARSNERLAVLNACS